MLIRVCFKITTDFWSVIFFIPEVAGKSLEEIDRVFDLPWYQIGLKGGSVNAEYDPSHVKEVMEEKTSSAEYLERSKA